MTETQASQNFAAMLHEVENGETVLITRDDGAPFARIVPEIPDRKTVIERLRELEEKYPPNPEFGEHLEKTIREMREWMDDSVREWSWLDKRSSILTSSSRR